MDILIHGFVLNLADGVSVASAVLRPRCYNVMMTFWLPVPCLSQVLYLFFYLFTLLSSKGAVIAANKNIVDETEHIPPGAHETGMM